MIGAVEGSAEVLPILALTCFVQAICLRLGFDDDDRSAMSWHGVTPSSFSAAAGMFILGVSLGMQVT